MFSDKGVFEYNLMAGQKYVIEAATPEFKPFIAEIQAPAEAKEMAFTVSLERTESSMASNNATPQEIAPEKREKFETEHLVYTETMDSLKFGPKSKVIMQKDIDKLKKEGYLKIKITGHYYGDNNAVVCMEQSKKMADYVRTKFVAQGVPFERIKIEGAGNTEPLTKDTKSKKGKAENTRIDVLLEY
ncbi:MAG: OmpA family protein [Bacteroidetes bacterium]|nr:OmpA family protein [Bacteroidota bacterium]